MLRVNLLYFSEHRNGSMYQQKRLQTVMKCKHYAVGLPNFREQNSESW